MTEDPHERELDDLEKEIKELESADENSEKPEGVASTGPEETSKEADKTYEEKSKDEWKRNEKNKDTRLVYTDDEIDIQEEDL